LNCQKYSLKTVNDKIACKPTWSKKITILSTFLDYMLNFLSNNLKNTTKFGKVREVVSKFELSETQFEKIVSEKITCKTHLE